MEEEISKRIREWRLERKLTLKELSEKTGLSISFLSQVERASSSIAITSLKKIADAVDVPIASFFEDYANKNYQVKVDEQKPFRIEGSGSIYTRLAGEFPGRTIEPLLVTLPAEQSTGKKMSHSGEEFYYVLEGVVVFDVDGKEYIVKSGDSIHFPSTIPHSMHNPLNHDVKVLSVVTPVIF
ncbi:DNA-binding protein [Bacillus canaveralius]|uniref:DNA-binding protein n=1 Tax=Bacillus canaveralius TaxID=1403243 RepID=A0A2N5GSP8_9BACI|nr:XRE family transcriptional regulator [Bacillus canaveralius]PLR86795.1 DNA-binding protein [Bacillus canaveralius]PLR92744.1 DNA-binding protein [Bacillus canaveralius]RSK54599.1 cupin domain-containing protein [Bacillus canaveralius]